MKSIFTFTLLLFCFYGNSQTLFEMLGEKVYLDKKIVAYSFYKSVKINDKVEIESNNPSRENPYNIYIFSDENKATIRIINKNLKEDIYLKFTNLFKMKNDENSDIYEFGGNSNCNSNLTVPFRGNEHQNLYINCKNGNESTSLIFTISKYDQL